MGKFGIGARVKDEDGDVGVIVAKPEKGERTVQYEGNVGNRAWLNGEKLTWSKKDITLIPDNDNAAEWVPKVGDRVRVVKHCNWEGYPIPLSLPIGSEHTVTERLTILDYKGVPSFILSGGGNNFYIPANLAPVPLPVAEQPAAANEVRADAGLPPIPAPLTIEAGKSYRTRDRRKVGPMVDELGNGEWEFEAKVDGSSYADGTRCAWRRDGTFSPWLDRKPHALDLVAEWVEPAAPDEVAVAEATATPVRVTEAKPGDVLLCDEWNGNFFTAGKTYTVRANGKIEDNYGEVSSQFSVLRSGNFSLVEPAAPPAKFKVGDRVLSSDGRYKNCIGTVSKVDGVKVYSKDWTEGLSSGWLHEDGLSLLSSTIPLRSTVTFTATGRLSAVNDNGHYQVTFPDLPAGRNSFALPAQYVVAEEAR